MTDTFWSGYGNALGAIGNVGGQIANRRAGARLGAGDYKGAAGALFDAGDLNGGVTLQNAARTQQTADAARQWEVAQRTARTLEQTLAQGGDVLATFDQLTPVYRQMGTDDNQIAQLRQGLAANPQQFLQAIKAAVPPKYQYRDGGAGDIVRVEENEGTATRIYDAPDRPIATQFGIILPPGAQGGMSAPNATAPLTGGAISSAPIYNPSAMEGITAQSESGSRERDTQGRLITSPAGAQGMMQVMPGTNTDPGYGVAPARDNSDAERTRVGREYLSAMMREYGGDPAKAWGAYNWGPGNLDRAIERYGEDWLNYAPAETQNYVANNLRQLNGSGSQQPEEQGDAGLPQDGTQDLGGGYRLQPMETAQQRRQAERDQIQDERFNRSDAREQARFEERNQPSSNDLRADRRMVTQEQQRLNTEFTKIPVVERFRNTEAEYADVRALARQRGGINSVALTYAIMKMAAGDGSVVRESEFDLVGRSAGIPDGTIALMQRAANGDALTESQRRQIEATAETLYQTRRTEYNREAARFRQFAADVGANPDRVAPVARGYNENGAARRRQTNAPGLPFNLNEAQLRARQRYQGDPSQPVGSARNARWANPDDPASSFQNARPGDFIYDVDGRMYQIPRAR